MSVSAQFNNIVKKYGDVTVVDKLNLSVKAGEFFTLLGPSGCGKTTLLRMVAGFNSIEGGELLIDNSPINIVPAFKRNMGMVFQNYAIFPHMTVGENVAYGLKARRINTQQIEKRVLKVLETMQIAHLKDRFPKNMSGGQQQRVALARAIVIEPTMLLMDEPLSNLDAKLRIDMRLAIKEIQKKVGITTIYVTHDQEEALAISDRIAVMDKGVIQQLGTPIEIYLRPANVFVATFIGHTNIIDATMTKNTITFNEEYSIQMDNVETPPEHSPTIQVKVGIRPEEFILETNTNVSGIKGTIELITFLGRYVQYQIRLSNEQIIEYTQDIVTVKEFLSEHTQVTLQANIHKINVFDKLGQRSLIIQ